MKTLKAQLAKLQKQQKDAAALRDYYEQEACNYDDAAEHIRQAIASMDRKA